MFAKYDLWAENHVVVSAVTQAAYFMSLLLEWNKEKHWELGKKTLR